MLVISVLCNLQESRRWFELPGGAHWLESESSDGAVQVTEVIHLEYIKPLPPFVVLDAEDAFDFAPTSIFFRISFENGYITLYADCSAFGIEIGEH